MHFKNLVLHRFSEFQLLFFWTAATLTVLLFHIKLAHSTHFLFLVWNLFLAFVPYVISLLFQAKPFLYVNRFWRWSLLLLWLLFFPNAPYILTDFIHLHYVNSVQWLFDFVLIGSFASLAFVVGLFSLRDVQKLLQLQYCKKRVNVLFGIICFVSGFGVYIGRISRLNSWDAILRPKMTLSIVFESLYEPLAWAMTFGFGLLLLAGMGLLKRKYYSLPST